MRGTVQHWLLKCTLSCERWSNHWVTTWWLFGIMVYGCIRYPFQLAPRLRHFSDAFWELMQFMPKSPKFISSSICRCMLLNIVTCEYKVYMIYDIMYHVHIKWLKCMSSVDWCQEFPATQSASKIPSCYSCSLSNANSPSGSTSSAPMAGWTSAIFFSKGSGQLELHPGMIFVNFKIHFLWNQGISFFSGNRPFFPLDFSTPQS